MYLSARTMMMLLLLQQTVLEGPLEPKYLEPKYQRAGLLLCCYSAACPPAVEATARTQP